MPVGVGQGQLIVVEFILLVPQTDAAASHVGHRLGDVQKMAKKLYGHFFIYRVVQAQFQGDAHHIQRIHRHPGRTVGLIDVPPGRQWLAAIEDADIVESEEPALKNIEFLDVFTVNPPGKVEHHLVEDLFKKGEIAVASALGTFHLEDTPAGPGVDRRIDITEIPLIRRQLAVGMKVAFPGKQQQLLLGEIGVDQGQGKAMKGQVPGSKPGVFPGVRHRHDIGAV